MNLFVTSKDPWTAAKHLDDKRVSKIILETAQVLSVVLLWRGVGGFYKPTHTGHPVTLWCAADPAHARWALHYGLALCEQYKRFGRKPVHASEYVLRAMKPYIGWSWTIDVPQYFQNSARNAELGLDFTHLPVHRAYREYLLARWPGDERPVNWTNRPRPKWAVF